MKKRSITVWILVLASAITMQAQNNFTLSPEKPKPGDKISFTYTPPAGFVTDQSPLRCDAYKLGFYDEQMKYGARPFKCELIHLSKNGDAYTGEVKTDPETRFLAFSFTTGKVVFKYISGDLKAVSGKIDVHNNEGYSTLFYDNNGRELSHSNLLGSWYYYQNTFKTFGFSNQKRARQMLEREIEIDSTLRFICMARIAQMLSATNPAETKKIATAELERVFQDGMKTEEGYLVAGGGLFYYAGFKNTGRYFSNLGKEKYGASNGFFEAYSRRDLFYAETDPDKKAKLAKELEQYCNKASWDIRFYTMAASNTTPGFYHKDYLRTLAEAGRIDELKMLMKHQQFPFYYAGHLSWNRITDTLINKMDPGVLEILADQYKFIRTRWESLKKDPDQPSLDPSEDCLTTTDRMKEVTGRLAYLNNQYATWYYKTGDYKKGFAYAKEAFSLIQDGDFEFYASSMINNTYLLLTEKLAPNECKGLIEKFIRANCYTPDMKDKLKKIYVDEKKSEEGFDQYYIALLKSASGNVDIKDVIASLQVNEKAPSFSLVDLTGKTVSLESLKGKTVILDFWATWCGPCIASFPAMSKLKDKYKDNGDVVFLFLNTWENDVKSLAELTQRISDFLEKRNLDYKVLLDAQSSASSDFGVNGIPTKIIIDKQGHVRYKITGAETDEYKLFEEMNAMIESVK